MDCHTLYFNISLNTGVRKRPLAIMNLGQGTPTGTPGGGVPHALRSGGVPALLNPLNLASMKQKSQSLVRLDYGILDFNGVRGPRVRRGSSGWRVGLGFDVSSVR